MVLYLIRHGQTLFDETNLVQGYCDSPLTSLGISQSITLGEKLKDIQFDQIYTSTSERTIDTLNYVLSNMDYQGNVIESKLLKGIDYGLLEACPKSVKSNILATQGVNLSEYDELLRGYKDYDGENVEEFLDRITEIFAEIFQYKGNVLVISDACVIQMFVDLFIKHENIDVDHITNCEGIIVSNNGCAHDFIDYIKVG